MAVHDDEQRAGGAHSQRDEALFAARVGVFTRERKSSDRTVAASANETP
jgi:hypothetical protein